ncbi:endonuclease/exonuclease/phosphatase family protein [Saccharospirillum impatiens]|uniref:endonuclease/exonuclease/phosphatase family protein n=1 Tax=Saccharospirillum impatiens TaxID=169438 RepID=UPI00042445A5|nr:endonuclease/exonuclease/phosphatase family protein [Saccharospirillum impatiens]
MTSVWQEGIVFSSTCKILLLATLPLINGCLEQSSFGSASNEDSTSGDSSSVDDQNSEYWLSAMTVNAEWLWDFDNTIDGEVMDAGDIPTVAEYSAEITYFSDLIVQKDANLVALQEIEGCHILDDFIEELATTGWFSICMSGRDTYTGQDVGILSRFPVVYGPTTFADSSGEYEETSVIPTKVVGAVVNTPEGNLAIITSHFLSKANPANDDRRAAQADAIFNNFNTLHQREGVTHGIVLGDFNDTPASVPLTILTSSGVLKNTLYANARVPTAADCSYTFSGNCELIDHLLITDSLAGGEFRIVQTDQRYTDHRAVHYRLKAEQ